jgi:hypothetical protein
VDFIPKSDVSELKIEASLTSHTLVIRGNKAVFWIINLNPDWTIKGEKICTIKDANIESITLSCSKLYVKSDGFYYE